MIMETLATLLENYNYEYGEMHGDITYPYIIGEHFGNYTYEDGLEKGSVILTLHHRGLYSELERLRCEVQEIFRDQRFCNHPYHDKSIYFQYSHSQRIPSEDLDLLRLEVYVNYIYAIEKAT